MFMLLIGRGGVARHPMGRPAGVSGPLTKWGNWTPVPRGFHEAPASIAAREGVLRDAWRRSGGALENYNLSDVGLDGPLLQDVEVVLRSKVRGRSVRRRPSSQRIAEAYNNLRRAGYLPPRGR